MTIRLAIAFWLCVGAAAVASAQSLAPGPPGPFVIDLRGVTSGVPSLETLLPTLPEGATLPTRGFGGSLGGHVYPLQIGPARLGIGVEVIVARGTTADATSRLTMVAPQVSTNFGSSDGWSYVSAGIGTARQRFDPGGGSDRVRAVNVGGGARWFLRRHIGVGFDVRVYSIASGIAPSATSLAAGVGISVK